MRQQPDVHNEVLAGLWNGSRFTARRPALLAEPGESPAWAYINRRLALYVERAFETVRALFHIAMIKLMARRIARYRDF